MDFVSRETFIILKMFHVKREIKSPREIIVSRGTFLKRLFLDCAETARELLRRSRRFSDFNNCTLFILKSRVQIIFIHTRDFTAKPTECGTTHEATSGMSS